jgi:hypothetical protein
VQAHAYAGTKATVDGNLAKNKKLLVFLQKHSEVKPDIDAFTLPLVFQNLAKRLNEKMTAIKDLCRKSNLNCAMSMNPELERFKQQLSELEDRAKTTNLIAIYLKPSALEKRDPLLVNRALFLPPLRAKNGDASEPLVLQHTANSSLAQVEQLQILRKQFDARMSSLCAVYQKQQSQMLKYSKQLRHLEQSEAAEQLRDQDFETCFEALAC